MPRQDTSLQLRSVTKRYDGTGNRDILREVNLTIAAGDYLAVVGRSGSGKSTLLNLLGGLDRPTTGSVCFGNRDLATLDDPELSAYRRSQLGFVFQRANLVPTLSVLENLQVPLRLNGVPARQARSRSRALLAQAELGELEGRLPEELSGGEQQRVAILRAVVHAPSIVIADEPTGNLDLDTATRTLDLLEHFGRQPGRSLIMATHSREVIGRTQRVIEIRAGRVTHAQ